LLKANADEQRALWRDANFVKSFREEKLSGFSASLNDWERRTVIAHAPHDESLNERNLFEVANERGVDAFDLAVQLSVESDLGTRFRLPVLNFREDEIAEILREPVGVIAFSDAGAHASQLCNVHYTTHLLEHWVRDTGTLTLEQGVHALTGRPAEVVGLNDRGRLAKGLAADIVIFDADTIKATPLRRVYDLPAGADRMICEAPGLETVIVNGAVIRHGGKDVAGDVLPGQMLRRH
jgi:N-acyl-D-amino-acid deacylase